MCQAHRERAARSAHEADRSYTAYERIGLKLCVHNRRSVDSDGSSRRKAEQAGEVLPKNVSMADAISNTARCGLLVSALYSGDYSLIDAALADRLHQPYRKTLIKGYDEVREAAKAAGAYGSCISGAGPTMLAFFSM